MRSHTQFVYLYSPKDESMSLSHARRAHSAVYAVGCELSTCQPSTVGFALSATRRVYILAVPKPCK
uniref:Uncharacterized protein n=1 Tax=Arundo donax TaxID=35708 RepID=A0A0A8YHT1_ARUDO